MRIAVVEDDEKYMAVLCEFLKRYEKENNKSFAISKFSDGLDILDEYKAEWDVILMDVEMPHLDGMTTAKKIREYDTNVLIIFITNMAQYAIHGYEVDAMDYVLKPVSYPAFAMKMRKVCRKIADRDDRFLVIQSQGMHVKILVMSIIYIEVADHKVIYHTEKEEYSTFDTLKNIEKMLNDKFVRCNHCYLVNMRYVDGIKDDNVILGNTTLKISRTKKKMFLERLSEYCKFGG